MERIDLAHSAPFRLAGLTVEPGTRELVRAADGAREVLEPRVMQVLVALAAASGAIVSRDDLTRRCWEGRVVGDDAINRVVSRLRRAAEGIGEGGFRIETVTKVGYRLIAEAPADAAPLPAADSPPPPVVRSPARRRVLIGAGGAVAVAALGGAGWWLTRQAAPSPEVQTLMTQAQMAAGQGNMEGYEQSNGLLRRVTQIAPDYAEGWGQLAMNYAAAATVRGPQYAVDMRARAIEAAGRAEAIDPANEAARAARSLLTPARGHWLEIERELRMAAQRHPDSGMIASGLIGILADVGRMRESVAIESRWWPPRTFTPVLAYRRVVNLWAAGLRDAADRAMDEAYSLFPTHFAVWFTRFYLFLYTGRASAALVMADDRENWPSDIAPTEIANVRLVAAAMMSGAAADIDHAMAVWKDAAQHGAGQAENAIQFASALGRLDDAFLVANGYYFERGFAVSSQRYLGNTRVYTPLSERRTRFLWNPSAAALRRDPRFVPLCDELGLARYWREAGVKPDFLA